MTTVAKEFTASSDTGARQSEKAPLLYRISRAMQELAVSRTTIYRMVARGELELVRLGARSSRITSASVARLIADQAQSSATTQPTANAPPQPQR